MGNGKNETLNEDIFDQYAINFASNSSGLHMGIRGGQQTQTPDQTINTTNESEVSPQSESDKNVVTLMSVTSEDDLQKKYWALSTNLHKGMKDGKYD